MKTSVKSALALLASLAALMGPLGCEAPYPLPPSQAWNYPGPPYPPPSWGPRPLAPTPPEIRGPMTLQDVEGLVWSLTNDIRRQYGVTPLSQDGRLAAVAQAYCDDMLRRRFFGHTNPEGLTAGDRLRPYCSGSISGWGENLWEGSNLSAADGRALARRIIDGWMSSPGHRQNLLSPDYTHLGVGVSALGREIRATQLFATLRQH